MKQTQNKRRWTTFALRRWQRDIVRHVQVSLLKTDKPAMIAYYHIANGWDYYCWHMQHPQEQADTLLVQCIDSSVALLIRQRLQYMTTRPVQQRYFGQAVSIALFWPKIGKLLKWRDTTDSQAIAASMTDEIQQALIRRARQRSLLRFMIPHKEGIRFIYDMLDHCIDVMKQTPPLKLRGYVPAGVQSLWDEVAAQPDEHSWHVRFDWNAVQDYLYPKWPGMVQEVIQEQGKDTAYFHEAANIYLGFDNMFGVDISRMRKKEIEACRFIRLWQAVFDLIIGRVMQRDEVLYGEETEENSNAGWSPDVDG